MHPDQIERHAQRIAGELRSGRKSEPFFAPESVAKQVVARVRQILSGHVIQETPT